MNQVNVTFYLDELPDGRVRLCPNAPADVRGGVVKVLNVSGPRAMTPPAQPMTDRELSNWVNRLPAGYSAKMDRIGNPARAH